MFYQKFNNKKRNGRLKRMLCERKLKKLDTHGCQKLDDNLLKELEEFYFRRLLDLESSSFVVLINSNVLSAGTR